MLTVCHNAYINAGKKKIIPIVHLLLEGKHKGKLNHILLWVDTTWYAKENELKNQVAYFKL